MDDSTRIRGQRNYSSLLSAMAERTQTAMAEALGIQESTLSELKGKGHLQRACEVIAAAGLKLVDARQRTYDPEELQALRVLARKGIDRDPPPSSFGDMT